MKPHLLSFMTVVPFRIIYSFPAQCAPTAADEMFYTSANTYETLKTKVINFD